MFDLLLQQMKIYKMRIFGQLLCPSSGMSRMREREGKERICRRWRQWGQWIQWRAMDSIGRGKGLSRDYSGCRWWLPKMQHYAGCSRLRLEILCERRKLCCSDCKGWDWLGVSCKRFGGFAFSLGRPWRRGAVLIGVSVSAL